MQGRGVSNFLRYRNFRCERSYTPDPDKLSAFQEASGDACSRLEVPPPSVLRSRPLSRGQGPRQRKSHSYFLDIVRSAGATVREVEISADGSNRCLEPEEPTEAIEVDDAESVVSEDADEVRFSLYRQDAFHL